jgi:hypothetical protein
VLNFLSSKLKLINILNKIKPELFKMGKIKLFLLPTILLGQLAFACGSSMTYQNGGQTNTSSACPSNPNSGYPGGSAQVGGMNYGPGYHEAMAAKAAAESKAAQRRHCLAFAEQQHEKCTGEANTMLLTDLSACNQQAVTGAYAQYSGGVIGGLGAAALVASGPEGWAILAAFGGGGLGLWGTGQAQEGNYQCVYNANNLYGIVLNSCAEFKKTLANRCPSGN